jgi:DNA-binding transcriptional LysR family regulator
MIPFAEPGLKTQWLEHFILLCQELELRKAAEKLGVSRQTLQRSLEQLEAHTQTPLLKKSGKGLIPTQAGQLFLIQAREVMASLLRLEQRFQTRSQIALSGTISFAWQSASGFDFLPRCLSQFMAEHPDVFLNIQCEPQTETLRERLAKGQIDLALMDAELEEEEFMTFSARRSPFVIVSAPRPFCQWNALVYALPRRISHNPRQKRWNDEKYPRQIVCNTDSLDVLLDWCLTGRAATFLPQITVQRYLDQGQLAIVALPPEAIYKDLFVASTPAAQAKPAVKALTQTLLAPMMA